jgi:hypothetical protein
MTNPSIENIGPISQQGNERNLQLLLDRAYSPYKSTLRTQTREDSLIKYLRGISETFYGLIAGNPRFLALIRGNPLILTLLATNNKIIDIILNKPILLDKFLEDPEGFAEKLSAQIKPGETIPKKTEAVPIKLNQKISQNLLDIQKAREALALEKPKPRSLSNYTLQRLHPPVIQKTQIENPNIQTSTGEFKTFTRGDYIKLAHSKGLGTDQANISNNKTFVSNPTLAGVLGALSAMVNFLKIKDSKEKGFEAETITEFENAKDGSLKEVSEISESEATTKISANLK